MELCVCACIYYSFTLNPLYVLHAHFWVDVCQDEKDSKTDTGRPRQQRVSGLLQCSNRDSDKRQVEPHGPGPFFFIGGGNGAPM